MCSLDGSTEKGIPSRCLLKTLPLLLHQHYLVVLFSGCVFLFQVIVLLEYGNKSRFLKYGHQKLPNPQCLKQLAFT